MIGTAHDGQLNVGRPTVGGRDLRTFIPMVTVASVLVLTLLVGLASSALSPRVLAMICVTFIGLVAALNYPNLGVALLPLVGVLVPFSIGTGTQSPLVAALLYAFVLVATWIARLCLRRRLTILNLPINLPLALFLLAWVLSYLYGEANHDRFVWLWDSMRTPRLGQLGVVLVSGLIFLLAANSARDLRMVKLATWGVIVSSIIPLAAYYLHHESFITFMDRGGLYTMWVVSLAYGQALFNHRLPWWLRWLLVAIVIAWINKAMIGQTLWFSGWVPAVVAVSIQTLIKSRRAFLLVAVVTTILVILNYDVVYQELYTNKVDEGDLSRIGIWQQALTLYDDSPVLGTGPAGYAAYNMTIYRGSQYSMSTHSGYMDIIIETGAAGVITFVWFGLTMLYVGWRVRSRWQRDFIGGFAQAGFGGLIGLFVAMQLGDWFIPFVYNETIAGFRFTVHSWVFLGYLLSLIVYRTPVAGSDESSLATALAPGTPSDRLEL